MGVALLGKCVALLGLVVLLYATCYGFRIREIVPQTHSAVCTSMNIRGCSDKMATTTTATMSTMSGGSVHPTRKWHEGVLSRFACSRKPFVDSLGDGTMRTRLKIERLTECSKDKIATRPTPWGSRTESVVIDDEEEEEEAVVEVEDAEEVQEIKRSVRDIKRDWTGRIEEDDEDKEEVNRADISDKDVEDKEGRLRKESKSEHDDDDEDVGKELFESDPKKQEKDTEIQIKAKIVKSTKYSDIKIHDADNDDDKDNDNKEEEKEKLKDTSYQQKVTEASILPKKRDPDKTQILQSDYVEDHEDKDETEESDTKKVPVTRKLEKVRLADKDKVKAKILSSKHAEQLADKDRVKTKILPSKHAEQPKREEEQSDNVTKLETENSKITDSVKRLKPSEHTEKPKENAKILVEATQKPTETTKKLIESTKKDESIKPVVPKVKAQAPETEAKVDEKSKARVKPITSTSVPRIKEQTKQSEKKDIKKTMVKSSLKLSKEVSQTSKRETKPKTRRHTDASITLFELNDAILHVPTFVPNFTNAEDAVCQQHGKIFLRQLRGYKLWALQMLDSSAKIPSGLLRGHVNQFGDYDQCLEVLARVKVEEKTIKIQGKYCLATIDLQASHPAMRLPVNLMQARTFIRNNIRDSDYFIPKFSTVNWALCLPAACSAKDAERTLENALEEYNTTIGIKFTVNVDPNMCYVKQKSQSYSKETIGVLYFYAMIICLVMVATVRDYFVDMQGKGNYSERIIMSFSLRRTIKALLRKTGPEEITCIHGIRALLMIVIYVMDLILSIYRLPFNNRTSLTEIANSPVSSILRASFLYMDGFLLLSGVLIAYNMVQELKVRGKIRWFCRFITRFIRLTPPLFAVLLWYAYVMEHIGSGPKWNSVVVPNAELCKQNAWMNLLYVQNLLSIDEMCATHTHHLALDMQLSLIVPVLIFFLHYKPLIGVILMAFLILLSATLRYIATTNNYLSLVVFHSISTKCLRKTFDLTYKLPLHRITPYIFGVGLGVLLRFTGKNVRIHKMLVILGWLIAAALGSWSLFSPWHMARRNYVYDVEEAAHYAVIAPVLWAMALCWLIFACFTEHGGIINKFLSNYWLMIFSKISYAVYLTQFAVFFYNIGTTRYSTTFQLHTVIDPLETTIVIAASVILTLFFDLPMQEVKNVIMESTDAFAFDSSKEKKTSAENKDELTEPAKVASEQMNVFEDDEISSIGWDWQKDKAHGAVDLGRHDTEENLIDPSTLKKVNGRQMSFIDRETKDFAEMSGKNLAKIVTRKSFGDTDGHDRKRDVNSQRNVIDDSEEEIIELLRDQREYEIVTQRYRRSPFKTKDIQWLQRESESEEDKQFGKSGSRGRTLAKEADDNHSWEIVGKEDSSFRDQHGALTRQSKSLLTKSATDAMRRTFSSESEEESSPQRRSKLERLPSSETKSSEEEWEHELRMRRKQFMEKLIAQQRETPGEENIEAGVEFLKRRSSAEGKIALMRDDLSSEDNMDSWTVSVGPRIALLGSSQEPSEPEEDGIYMQRREYREQGPPSREESQSEEESSQDTSRRQSYTSGSQKTSLEKDDTNNHNFVLTKDSKRESLQDLSKLSQEELTDSGWNVVRRENAEPPIKTTTSTGLFKRESIVKSQASEEDPEYLLPERPKLIQQEREHPFKKAWQMQKSRSEEDGSSAYAIKDSKEQQSETKPKGETLSIKREHSDEQSEDIESNGDEEATLT